MVHISNLPHILTNGITNKNSVNADPKFAEIGDVSLIDKRSRKIVSIDNGNYTKNSSNSIVLGNFIPFYFGVRMPMLYVIQKGGNFVEKPIDGSQIVYIVCRASNILESCDEIYFSDGHATDNFTSFYDRSCIERIGDIVDWEAIRTGYWAGHDNLNLKRKKQAEFLVRSDIPLDCIYAFICKTDSTKSQLLQMGIGNNFIKVRPQSYY